MSFTDHTHQRPVGINSDDDFRMGNPVVSSPVGGIDVGGRGGTPLATMVMDTCPCELDVSCEQDCCIEALRATHRARVARINPTSAASSKPLNEDRVSISSYGSLDSLNEHMLVGGPHPKGMEEGGGGGEEDKEPLLNQQRNLVST